MPLSGIYFVLLKIYLKYTVPKCRYGLRLKSSYSDRTLSVWTSNYIPNGELTLSDNIRLSVGERVFIKLQVERGNVVISEQSLFSMHLLGEFSLLPSFLARPVIDERILPNKNTQIFNWKKYHESMTSFSGAGGIFVPLVTGYYICNLNLVMKDVYGIIQITFNSNNKNIFTASKIFEQTESVASIHLSKIFSLQKNIILTPNFKSRNASLVISKTTTFSCALSDHKERSMELSISSSPKIVFDARNWWEVNLWKISHSSKYFKLLEVDGKVFSLSEDSLVLISLSLTVRSMNNNTIIVAVIPGGVKSEDGTCRSILQLRSNKQETTSLTCYIKVKERESSYISAFIKGGPHVSLNIVQGELKVIVIERPLSVLTTPFFDSSYSLNSGIFGLDNDWQVLKIDKLVQSNPFRTSSIHWNVDEYSIAPKESGIYYISVNLQATVRNFSSGVGDTFEAKIVVLGSEEINPFDLQYNNRGMNGFKSSLILAGTFSLKSNDKIYVTYRCTNCDVSQSSGFSAMWLFKLFKVEGFSTTIKKSKKLLLNKSTVINKWSRYFSNFIRTSSFSFEKGIYRAPLNGMYLVTCSITVENISVNARLKLRLNIANSTNSYTEYFYTASEEKRVSSLVISMPIWLKQGQYFSLLLEADNTQDVVLRKGSTLAIVAIANSQDKPMPGFTLSLRENLKSLAVMPLLDWTDAKITGTFFNGDDDLFNFNKRQGEIIIKKPAVMMLNIVVNTKLKGSKELILNIKIEEKDIERIFTSRSLHQKESEPMKISLVLYVRRKNTIRVEVRQSERGSFYDVLDNTVMSAIFLSNVPTKPGLMLGVRGYSASLGKQRTIYRCKFDLRYFVYKMSILCI